MTKRDFVANYLGARAFWLSKRRVSRDGYILGCSCYKEGHEKFVVAYRDSLGRKRTVSLALSRIQGIH